VFINDLEDGMLTDILKFADDTKVYSDVSDSVGKKQPTARPEFGYGVVREMADAV
jgi:hypothetical protein